MSDRSQITSPVPERRVRLRELPLWPVLVVAGLVLFVGYQGRSERAASAGTAEADEQGPRSDRDSVARRVAAAGGDVRGDGWRVRLDEIAMLTGDAEAERRAARTNEERAPSVGTSDDITRRVLDARESLVATSDLIESIRTSSTAGGAFASEVGPYVRGVREGEWLSRWAGGEVRSKGRFEDGLKEGLWQEFSPAGLLVSETVFAEGERHGQWRTYAHTGEQIGEGNFEHNLRAGLWTLWYSDGRVKERGRYVNGLREGVWEFYDDLGAPTVRSGVYLAGVKID